MADKIVKINKVDDSQPLPKLKTLKTFPKGILKRIRPVKDSAKNPPLKKTMKRNTIRLMSDKTIKSNKKTIKQKLSKMPEPEIKAIAKKNGLSEKTPVPLLKEIIEGGMIAGFISS